MKLKPIFLLFLLVIALAACSPAGGEPALPDEPTAVPTEPTAPEKVIEAEATVETMSIMILE